MINDALKYHKKHKGKIGTLVISPVKNRADLSLAYTPGVAEASKEIAKNKKKVFDYTIKGHTVGIVTDGSAVLGLGNIGPEAALPVMEGKAALFKTFANLDAFPVCLTTQNVDEIVATVKNISPVFGAINLEDIAAPRCFEVEEKLQSLGIPVMHDDQHGTAVVVLAGLINAAIVTGKKLKNLKVVILGSGAAGSGIVYLIKDEVSNIICVDSKGIISKSRKGLEAYKQKLAKVTNKQNLSGSLQDALMGADALIGVSTANIVKENDIKLMGNKPVIFAMANPNPEIMPDRAKKAGAYVVATGRSDFANQINNSLAFPGIFKGALSVGANTISQDMKKAAATEANRKAP
ncbi:MAG: NADP-dependent malic enzyme [Candidatus Blackburnbacteria bacterium]|nr:NADP-dependent malic enzyme [Candidatus Blackburnbacteria bacterium]